MSIQAATFDPAARLDLYFRKNRDGSKKFVFTDGNGTAYSLSGIDLKLNIKYKPTDSTNVLQLTVGSGLTVGGASNNELTIALTDAQSNIKAVIYYWELFNDTDDKTWLYGEFILYAGIIEPITETDDLTINLDPDVVNVSIGEPLEFVTSVNGQSGPVTLTKSSVDLGDVDNISILTGGAAELIPFLNTGGTGIQYDTAFYRKKSLNNFVVAKSLTFSGSGTLDNNFFFGDSITVSGGSGNIRWAFILTEGGTIQNLGAAGKRIHNVYIGPGTGSVIRNDASGNEIFSGAILHGNSHILEAIVRQVTSSIVLYGRSCTTKDAGVAMSGRYKGRATGHGSIALGFVTTYNGTTSHTGTVQDILASGIAAVNISSNSPSSVSGEGALADHCVIFGTIDGHITTTSPRSFMAGGNSLKMPENSPDTFMCDNLLAQSQTVGNKVVQYASKYSTTDLQNPSVKIYQNRTTTTDATLTTLHTLATSSDSNITITGYVLARRTGGSAGSAGDVASYEIKACYKNVGGTLTQISASAVSVIGESQAGWDCQVNISSANLLIQVQGAINNVTWHLSELKVMELGS